MTVFADRLRLRQILVNLLTNAIKYNRRGGRVLVSVWRDEGGDVSIEVSDDRTWFERRAMCPFVRTLQPFGAESTGIEGTGIGRSSCAVCWS